MRKQNRKFRMRSGGKAILTGMALSLFLFFQPVNAENTEQFGNITDQKEVTVMDEDCNILPFEDETSPVIEVQDEGIETYAASAKVVNFRATAAGGAVAVNRLTEYKEKDTGYNGYITGANGADGVYLGTENGKVKFMISGVIGLIDASKVQVLDRSKVQSVSNYYVKGSNLYHRIATNLNSAAYGSTINLGPAPSFLQAGITYYSYDGHYFYTDYAVMAEDYQNSHRNRSANVGNPYYNYYQYLPLRAKSNYTAAEIDQKIRSKTSTGKMLGLGSTIIKMQNQYGVNALAVTAVAANESGWGKSNIAMTKNNLFGLNAVDSSPNESANIYASVEKCVQDFTETYMSKRYLRAGYTYYKGGFFGNKASGINVSYGSDPYWGEKAAAIMWNLDSDQKDRYQYTIGIKDLMAHQHTDLNVRKEADTSSTKMYSTGLQSATSFLILESTGNFYKIQTDPVLNAGRTAVDTSTGVYINDTMYGYVSKDYVTLVSGEAEESSGVSYSTHVQSYGWQTERQNGATAGTEGEAKRLEALRVRLKNLPYSGSVRYIAHVQSYGWQDWVADGAAAGTTGEAKRLEAVRIELKGEAELHYDIYYRVHVQTYGWLGWAKNGEVSGTTGYAKRLEALQVVLVEKGGQAPGSTENAFLENPDSTQLTPHIKYQSHVQTYGWQTAVQDGALSGTTGKAKRLEAMILQLTGKPVGGGVEYQSHVQTYGWESDWKQNGELSGTEGEAKRLEAIRIQLTGEMEKQYDIYYRVHTQTYGWLGWAKNGESAGTEGLGKRMEAIQIRLVKKGEKAPTGTQAKAFIK